MIVLLFNNVNELKNSFYSSSSLVCLSSMAKLWYIHQFTIHHTPYIHHYSTEQEKQKTKQNKNSTKKILSHWIQFTPWILSSSSYEWWWWWWLFLFDGDFIIVVVVVLNLIFFLIFFRRRRRRRFASSLGSFLLLFSKKKNQLYTHTMYIQDLLLLQSLRFSFSLFMFSVCVVCFRLRKTYNWWFCG